MSAPIPSIRVSRAAGHPSSKFNFPVFRSAATQTPPTGASTSALTAEETIACVQAAVAAQAGLVKEVEGEDEKGKRLCEVKIVDETGKRHKLHIDVQTNQVVKAK